MDVKVATILMLLTAGTLAAQQAKVPPFPEGPGKDKFELICSFCHSPTHVLTKEFNKAEWTEMVIGMLQEEEVSQEEKDAIIEYLARNYPRKVNVNKAPAADLQKALDITEEEAQAVVEFRKSKGAFKTSADLAKIPGWNSAKIEPIRKRIQF